MPEPPIGPPRTDASVTRYRRVFRVPADGPMLVAVAPGGTMSQVEIFTPTGVVSGTTARTTLGTDAKGAAAALPVDASRWYSLDGSEPQRRGSVTVAPDEILVVVLAQPGFTVHASWYPIELEVGPYRLDARLPVAPGFDPARALARPTGAFVTLKDVSLSLIGRTDAGVAERGHAQVNRYAVDHIRSNLMLGFFFPGATLEPLPDQGAVPQVMAMRSVATA